MRFSYSREHLWEREFGAARLRFDAQFRDGGLVVGKQLRQLIDACLARLELHAQFLHLQHFC